MMGRRSLMLSLLALAAGCAGLPGAVKPVGQPFAPAYVKAPVVRARVCGREDVALPDGWRLPTAVEVSDDWRGGDPGRFLLADADLDGDGRPDQARVLFRTDGTAFGVFAFLCCGEKDAVPHLILHNRELTYFKVVGIRPLGPGRYRTACGRGFIDCYLGEPHEVQLTHAAIDYFRNESVTSLFYWSDGEQTFKWVAITDGGVRDDAVASTK
jgi:hypothetical protein